MPFKMCECEDVGLSPRHHLNIYIAWNSLIKGFLSFNKSHVYFHIFSHSYFQFSFFLILLYVLETVIAFMLDFFFFTLSSMNPDSLLFTILCLSPSCITKKTTKKMGCLYFMFPIFPLIVPNLLLIHQLNFYFSNVLLISCIQFPFTPNLINNI